jgi:hypothetical protein
MCVENKLVNNWLNLNLSLDGPSWPLYIGGQVSRIWLGSIQITMLVYVIILCFDYNMIGHNSHGTITQTGPRSTKIMGLSNYTLVRSSRDSTRIVDSG